MATFTPSPFIPRERVGREGSDRLKLQKSLGAEGRSPALPFPVHFPVGEGDGCISSNPPALYAESGLVI